MILLAIHHRNCVPIDEIKPLVADLETESFHLVLSDVCDRGVEQKFFDPAFSVKLILSHFHRSLFLYVESLYLLDSLGTR